MNLISFFARLKFFLFFFLVPFSLLKADASKPVSHTVIVSVAPYKYFVEKIAGDTVKVILLVPAGTSFHSYEPTPRQMLAASNADIWFRIGESFEQQAAQALASHNPHLRFVDLRKGIDLIVVDSQGKEHKGCCGQGGDLHFWLSPKWVKVQAKAIAQALSDRYPEHAQEYQRRLSELLSNLDDLDREITSTLKPLQNRVVMVSHPAYAYFAADYCLTQLPIEFEGRDPSPRQLTDTLNQARRFHIKTIFTQPQHSSKGANLIAQELGANIVQLDPYAENYFESMRAIAHAFAAQNGSR